MTPSLVCILLTVCFPINQKHLPSAANGATFCQIYQPVYIAPTDTRKTKEQVDSLNRVWKELCQKK